VIVYLLVDTKSSTTYIQQRQNLSEHGISVISFNPAQNCQTFKIQCALQNNGKDKHHNTSASCLLCRIPAW